MASGRDKPIELETGWAYMEVRPRRRSRGCRGHESRDGRVWRCVAPRSLSRLSWARKGAGSSPRERPDRQRQWCFSNPQEGISKLKRVLEGESVEVRVSRGRRQRNVRTARQQSQAVCAILMRGLLPAHRRSQPSTT